MAQEILNLEVKSNIKGAVKDMDALRDSVEKAYSAEAELNKNIELQNEFIATQETELIRLKEIQDSIPKGAWHAGQSELADNIRQVTSEIRSEKDALKKLKKEQKDLAKAIRDKTSAQKKDTNAAIRGIQHFQIMGVSIRKLKFMVRGVIPMFKLLFGTIKSGIASTGIGVLILALISIGTSMKKSVAGGKAFKVMMDGIGKVTDVIIGSLTFLGDLMLSVFGFDSSTSAAVTAAENLKSAYEDLGREMNKINEQDAEVGKRKAKNKRLIDDETLSEKERLAAATDTYVVDSVNLKNKTEALKKNIKLKKEEIRLAKSALVVALEEEEAVGEKRIAVAKFKGELSKLNVQESNANRDKFNQESDFRDLKNDIRQTQIDKDAKAADEAKARGEKRKQKRIQNAKEVAAAETTLAKQIQKIQDELQYESLSTKIEVDKAKLENTYDRAKLEIENSIASQETIDEALLLLKKKYDEDLLELTDASDAKLAELRQENDLLMIADERALADRKLEIQRDAELKSIEGLEESEALKAQIKKKYNKIQGKINTDRGEQDVAIAKATTNDQIAAFGQLAGALSSLAGDNKELAAASAIIDTYVGANKAFAQGGVAGFVTGAALIAAGLANVQKIYATDVPGGGGGGGAASAPPAPQMMSGAFELTGGVEPEPLQAYVVSDDITDSQNGLAIIRRRATI